MKPWLMLVALGCILLASACGSSSSEPLKVDSVTLARDDGNGNPGETVTSFKPTDHIMHMTATLNHIETGLKVKLTLIAVDAGGTKSQTVSSTDFSGLVANQVKGKFSLPNDWPTGKYRLDIYLNDALAKSVDFNVA